MSARDSEFEHSPEENAPLNGEKTPRSDEIQDRLDDGTLKELVRAQKSLKYDKINDSVWRSSFNIIYDSIPSTVYPASVYIMRAIDLSVLSKTKGTVAADAIGISATWLMMNTTTLIMAVNNGAAILIAQAFGAQNFTTVGLCLHRALLLRVPVLILSFLLLMTSYWIFRALDIDENIASEAATYCRYATISLVPFAILDTLKSYMFANQIFSPIVVIMIIGVTIHGATCCYFVEVLDLGVKGAALAYCFNRISCAILLILYFVIWKPTKSSLFWPRKESFEKLLAQLKNEITIGGMTYLDSSGWELMTLIVGSYSAAQISAFTIIYSILSLAYMPIVGLEIVFPVYTAKFIGEEDIALVKKTVKYAIAFALVIAFLELIVFSIWRNDIFALYTSDQEVIEIGIRICWICVCLLPFEYLRSNVAAILKVIGRERELNVVYIISYYLVGFTSEYILGTVLKWYDLGVWIGLNIGGMVILISVTVFLVRTDYSKQLEKIKERVEFLD